MAKEAEVRFAEAVRAEIKEIIGRTGTRGGVIQVICKVLDGRDKNKTLRRNVRGPIRKGDIIMLTETEIEAQRLNRTKRKS